MIIATDTFDIEEVKSLLRDGKDLCTYVRGLIPDRYKHVDGIYHNTRYYLNLTILKSDKFTLEDKMKASAALTRGLHVVGYLDSYLTCGVLERRINMNKVIKYFEGEKYGKGS